MSAAEGPTPQSDRRHAPVTPLDGPRLLRALTPGNLLSFGPDTPPLPLGPLNVLVGPNGSGKSNLLEVIDLLRSSPGDMGRLLSRGGGVREWIWKGAPQDGATLDAEVVGAGADLPDDPPVLRHDLGLRVEGQRFQLAHERIEQISPMTSDGDTLALYTFARGRAVVVPHGASPRLLSPGEVPLDVSILARRRDPDLYPALAQLAHSYEAICLYREWSFGRGSVLRRPQQADLRSDRLEEDFSNLGLVLNRMRRQPRTKSALIERLRDLYDGLTDVDVSVEGGTVQVFFTEGDYVIPATRLSDGSLRYLCLLAILLDPDPPPLVGLEEPELGLHPDLLPKIADLLVDASTRTQLVVTTHSDAIVDALTDRPESVVVFDKHDGRTTFERLDRTALAGWLEKYRLGQLWTRGQIGGTRW